MRIQKVLESIIFNSKWLLYPFYLKLIWTLVKVFYAWTIAGHLTNEQLMATLEDVDIVMIANLVKMIITGSYTSFINKSHSESSEHVSSGMLKVKMATSIVGVSSVHLLKTFINPQEVPQSVLNNQIMIHGFFIIGAIMFSLVDYLHVKSENHESRKNSH